MNQPLPPMPPRIASLARDHRGFPVPWFVQWFRNGEPAAYGEGEPDVMDHSKLTYAIRVQRCWVCGGPLGKHLVFVLGPMCAVNRVTAEPPCHFECAEFSAMGCPFLTRPRMRRNRHEMPKTDGAAGFRSNATPPPPVCGPRRRIGPSDRTQAARGYCSMSANRTASYGTRTVGRRRAPKSRSRSTAATRCCWSSPRRTATKLRS